MPAPTFHFKSPKESLVIKVGTALLTLCMAGVCSAQLSTATAQTQAKHYRLTFVLSYGQGQQPSQTFVLDVPVTQDRAGMAGTSTVSGLTGDPAGNAQESLECTEVRESATGLAANVAFSMDSVVAPLPGSAEPRHRNLTFRRQVDLVLGTPTRITEEMHVIPLGKGDAADSAKLPPAAQITVTAVAI